jgi:NAD(P)-dependent dehydrogenase (short-subunit alcohol dehydrogenase family)
MTEPGERPLEGRVALVTGGTSGIGLATARHLADLGAAVAVTHRPGSEATGEDVVADLRSRTPGALGVPMDVTVVQSIRRGVRQVEQEHGRIDLLVNSAGTNVQQLAKDVDEATWDLVLGVNLKGTFFVCQAVAELMARTEPAGRGGHSIVNVASQMGLVGYHRRAAYCASKAGVVNLTRALAVEWAADSIRVNAVAPTFIKTPLSEPMLEEEGFRTEVLDRSPLRTIGEPDDIVAGVAYLSGDGARLVTGHTLSIDGGWTAW